MASGGVKPCLMTTEPSADWLVPAGTGSPRTESTVMPAAVWRWPEVVVGATDGVTPAGVTVVPPVVVTGMVGIVAAGGMTAWPPDDPQLASATSAPTVKKHLETSG